MDATIIANVRVFDGERVTDNQTVTIKGTVISSITPAHLDVSSATIDGTGCTLLPGLIDSHVHTSVDRLRDALRFGVTTELEMMGYWPAERRQQIAQMDNVADVRSAGFGLTAPNGHPTELHEKVKAASGGPPGRGGGPAGAGPGRGGPPGHGHGGPQGHSGADTASTLGEALAFVDKQVGGGADYIKIMIEEGSVLESPGLPVLDKSILSAAVDRAHKQHGKLTIAHTLTMDATETAVSISIDGLAHLFIDQPHTPEIVKMISDRKIFVTPCLCLNASIMNTGRGAEFAKDDRVKSKLDQAWLKTISGTFNTFPSGNFNDNLATVKALHTAGVDILAGTDASVPVPELGGLAHGASVHHELQLLVGAGLTPLEALKAATSVPARRFNLNDRGKIQEGMRADLLLVKGNPAEEIGDSLNIQAVWRRGSRLGLNE
ncbi:hypothetical protein FRB95_004441 [Tulasnella sp. JGI-2019a]|nr:hypothetical protein FRB95_004441 [Tulasnella sp. JGI-2019a]